MVQFKDKKLLIVCNTFRGRRLKFYELQRRMFDDILILSGHAVPGYDNLLVYKSLDELRRLISEYDPDVVHCNIDHTAPARAVMELGYKTILDVHDFSRLRGIPDDSAKEVYESAQQVIFVNNEVSEIVKLNFDIKNSSVIFSLIPANWMVKECVDYKRHTIVTIGSMAKSVPYRNIDSILSKLIDEGYEVHNYAPVGSTKAPGVINHAPVFGRELYSEIAQYEVGLLACNTAINELEKIYYQQYGLSNRTFDYMAARIPTVAINMGPVINYYIDNWGETCAGDDAEIYVKAIDAAIMKPIDFNEWQRTFNLDNHFDELKRIYETAIEG